MFQIRFLVTHIYSLFDGLPELNETKTETNETWNIFRIAFNISAIEPTIDTYRDQLMHLSRLNIDKPQAQLYKPSEFKTFPLRVALGLMHSNFKLLWKPCMESIESFAHGLTIEDFWPVFLTKIKSINKYLEEVGKQRLDEEEQGILAGLRKGLFKKGDKEPDFLKFRIMLWNCMAEFPDVVHQKNRDVVPIFFDFIE